MITTVVLLVHVLLALVLIGLILIQHGKGADAGAAFGSGASSTVFGAQGSASFLSRATKWLAILFFITSGTLAYLSRDAQGPAPSIMDALPGVEQQAAPSEDAAQDLPPVAEPTEEEPAETVQPEETTEEDLPPPASTPEDDGAS
ncbi:MAG TPA: preprotein translocase subunit SecG [Gammaproteobacteria bacterium]